MKCSDEPVVAAAGGGRKRKDADLLPQQPKHANVVRSTREVQHK